MNRLFRHKHQGRSGVVALLAFLLVYTAAIGLVIVPDLLGSGMGVVLDWVLG